MIRGTTPTIRLTLNNIDLASLKSIYITIRQMSYILTKKSGESGVGIEGNTISLYLTQEESLSFKAGYPAEIQVRGLTNSGNAFATAVSKVDVKEVLLEGVIDE